MHFEFFHEMTLGYDEFTKLWEHSDYLPFLVENHPRLRDVIHIERKDEGGLQIFNHLVKPELPIPSSISKFLSSDMLQYHEIVSWNTRENRHTFQAVMHDATFITLDGWFTLRQIEPLKHERITTLNINVAIPLAGKAIAQYLASQMDESYRIEAEIRGRFARTFLHSS